MKSLPWIVPFVLASATAAAQPAPPPGPPVAPTGAQLATQPGTPTTTEPAPQRATQPPPTTPPPPPLAPGEDATERVLVDRASEMIAQGRAGAARQLLDGFLLRSPMPEYTALPVLQRLATRMSYGQQLEPLAPARPSRRSMERSSLELFELYEMSFVYAVGSGVYLDVILELEDVRTAVWIPVALGAGGIAAAYAIDHGHPVRRGRASSANTGMVLGLTAGLALAWQIDENLEESYLEECVFTSPCFRTSPRDLSVRDWLTFGWLGATIGMGAGIGLGILADASPGDSALVFAGGLWGGALGALTNGAGDTDENYGTAILVGEGLGIGLAALGAHYLRPPESQVRYMNLGVLAGALLGVGIGILPQSDNPATVIIPIELGMIGGGILGYWLGAPPRSERGSRVSASNDRFRADPTLTPTQGGAVVNLNFPNLL